MAAQLRVVATAHNPWQQANITLGILCQLLVSDYVGNL